MTKAAGIAWVVGIVALVLLVLLIRKGRQLRRAEHDSARQLELLERYICQLVLGQLAPHPDRMRSVQFLAERLVIPWEALRPALSRLEGADYIRIVSTDHRGREIPAQVLLTERGRDALGR